MSKSRSEPNDDDTIQALMSVITSARKFITTTQDFPLELKANPQKHAYAEFVQAMVDLYESRGLDVTP